MAPFGLTPLDAVLAAVACVALLGLAASLLTRRRGAGEADGVRALAAAMARDGAALRIAVEARLGELGQRNADAVSALGETMTRRLHASVEDGMRSSFARVTEQFASVQNAIGDMQATASRLADLRRLFGNVRARGAWGERQLKALLDDVLPAGSYEQNCRLRDGSGENVEFAIRMPVAAGAPRKLLAIDAKFPTDAYERLLAADEEGDADAARLARRALEAAIRAEARRIGAKYVVPPATVDYAILYLPTDGLYVEVSRLSGLVDEVGRNERVLVMGPALLPGLLRSIQLGYVTLALGEKAEAIGQLLAATRGEVDRLDAALERLARNARATIGSIDEARRRTRAIARRLADQVGGATPPDRGGDPAPRWGDDPAPRWGDDPAPGSGEAGPAEPPDIGPAAAPRG